MDKQRQPEDRLGDILEVKLLLFEKSLDQLNTGLSGQISQNREVVSIMFKEIKGEVVKIEKHLEKINGSVKANDDSIIVLQECQKNDDRIHRKMWWFITAIVSAALFSMGIALVNHFSQ